MRDNDFKEIPKTKQEVETKVKRKDYKKRCIIRSYLSYSKIYCIPLCERAASVCCEARETRPSSRYKEVADQIIAVHNHLIVSQCTNNTSDLKH